jgi:hypothetical protein
MTYAHLYRRKIKLYQRLYEFTQSQCSACEESNCACKDKICAHVESQARKRGHRFGHTGHELRFIGCAGCVVPPHLRETCTIYLCEPAQAKSGFKKETYEKLKRLCERIDWRLMELEEETSGSSGMCRETEPCG